MLTSEQVQEQTFLVQCVIQLTAALVAADDKDSVFPGNIEGINNALQSYVNYLNGVIPVVAP